MKYKIITAIGFKDLERKINKAAAKGWRAVNAFPASPGHYGWYVLMEKETDGSDVSSDPDGRSDKGTV